MDEENNSTYLTDEILETNPLLNTELIEDYKEITLIWFKSTTNTSDGIDEIQEELQALHNCVLFHDDIDTCLIDIQLRKEKIFLIVAGNQAYALLPKIVNQSQLDSIFIYAAKSQEYARLHDDFDKVLDIFDNPEDLIKSIKKNIKKVNRQMEVLSFYNQCQRGTRNLEEQSIEFLWFRLFKDVIQHLPHDDQAKTEMLVTCREYFRDKPRILKDINEFEISYHVDDCIKWYTKETFVYKLINTALRTEDIEQLYTFRYYISDLSKQLAQKYELMKNGVEKRFILYRGVPTTRKEFEKLKTNIGKLFAVNSYWSTTRKRSCALTFAKSSLHCADIVTVLYEIECNLEDQHDSAIFSDITHLSWFGVEEEILFDAGAIFRIENIKEEEEEDHTKVYTIQIKITAEEEKLEKQYRDNNRIQMNEEGPRIMLSRLLKRMGKFKKSLQFLYYLLKNPNGENLAYIHNRIGIALKDEKQYKKALIHLKKAFQMTFYSNPPDKKYSAYVLHHQGLVYAKQKKYRQALQYYRRAVSILKNQVGESYPGIAQFYNSIGRVYLHNNFVKQALQYQQKALQIRKSVKPNHAMNAFVYADIAKIYSTQNKFKKALKYHGKALELRKEFLPGNNHWIASSLHQVGKMFYNLNDLSMAREYFQKSLEIFKNYAKTNLYFNIPNILEDIASTYENSSQEALDHQLQALDFRCASEPTHCPSLSRSLHQIALVYKSTNQKENLINFYQRALQIREKHLSNDKPELACLLDDIAFTYKSISRREDAINYYQKALKIREEYLSNTDLDLSYSFRHLACFYEEIDDMENASMFYNKQLQIYEHYYPRNSYLCKNVRSNINRVKQKSYKSGNP